MPYFRYFGPTAIMPGFKQMVVKVNETQHGTTGTSSVHGSLNSPTPAEAPAPFEPPIYDSSEMRPSPLIVHLCETFFIRFGCSFPFLQQKRFMRDLEAKQVDAILVDSVCALAARFSTDIQLIRGNSKMENGKHSEPVAEIPPPERGQAFAQRAKVAIIDSFPCPSVAVVQAALLLAYDEFGANRDSGLWMYLGIAIRMAQDLGMQKVEGLKYIGRSGPTPQNLKSEREKKGHDTLDQSTNLHALNDTAQSTEIAEQKANEKERVDTFWTVFCLDRYVSSGTGRPVALRDEEIEVAFPPLSDFDADNGLPLPWPALLRIVHLCK
jgi:hypothetical protein